jgi:hypothetical protein
MICYPMLHYIIIDSTILCCNSVLDYVRLWHNILNYNTPYSTILDAERMILQWKDRCPDPPPKVR